MKATLTSMHKQHLDNILAGKKRIEWRTRPLPLGIHYAYEAKKGGGSGMVLATFEVTRHYAFTDVSDIPEHMIREGCVSREWLKKYTRGRTLFANIIISPEKLIEHRYLWEFTKYSHGDECDRDGVLACDRCGKGCKVTYPPQSFMYIDI